MIKLARIAFLSMVLLCSGCSTFYHQRYPVIPLPEKPVLVDIEASSIHCLEPEVNKRVRDNFSALVDYAKELQVSVETYNEFAKSKNKELSK